MELRSFHSSKDLYASALSSPSPRRCASFNGIGTHFYSAPTSPNKGAPNFSFDHENKSTDSSSDEFEFETSKKFRLEGLEFENSQRSDYFSEDDNDDDDDQVQDRPEENWEEEPDEMAFADDLFKNGLILPLPPRLQLLHPPSPKSPSSMLRFPYPHRRKWNDEYDPFSTALDKVADDKIGKKIPHRRTQSFVPFRTSYSPQASKNWSQPLPKKENPHVTKVENRAKSNHRRARSFSPFRTITPTCGIKGWSQPLQDMDDDFDPFAVALEKVKHEKKGNARHRRAYSFSPLRIMSTRWSSGGSNENQHHRNHQTEAKPNELMVGTERDAKHEGKIKENNEPKGVKGFLMRYASLGGDKYDMKLKDQIGALWKRSYFRVLSFRVKQHDQSNTRNKKVFDDPKMEVAHYRPGMALCLSFESGRKSSSP